MGGQKTGTVNATRFMHKWRTSAHRSEDSLPRRGYERPHFGIGIAFGRCGVIRLRGIYDQGHAYFAVSGEDTDCALATRITSHCS